MSSLRDGRGHSSQLHFISWRRHLCEPQSSLPSSGSSAGQSFIHYLLGALGDSGRCQALGRQPGLRDASLAFEDELHPFSPPDHGLGWGGVTGGVGGERGALKTQKLAGRRAPDKSWREAL
jgi:hypothetical protein